MITEVQGLSMYEKDFSPFYQLYADSQGYGRMQKWEQEYSLMKTYYPGIVQEIQQKVEQECDLMDYKGSRIYDSYPDKEMLYGTAQKIEKTIIENAEMSAAGNDFLEELVQILLLQEVFRRRCHRDCL